MTKDRILLALIYIAGALSLLIFIITKNEALMTAATQDMGKYGDLYRLTRVKMFKTDLPDPVCDETGTIDGDPDTAPVVMIGDSFLETCRGHDPLPAAVSEKLNQDVATVYAGNEPDYFNPVYFCWKNGMTQDRKRIIVLERTERYILSQYRSRPLLGEVAFRRMSQKQETGWWDVVRRRWFTKAEMNYSIFFNNCDYLTPFIELWNTYRFKTFGAISDETPVYSLHPPFLFYEEEALPGLPTSFYYPHSDSTVGQIALNISLMSAALKSRYNAELVFMPIPSAYTLYHGFVNNDPYDNFIPRLCSQLEQRGVRTIRLYDVFRKSGEILFFPTDSHWNAAGARLATDEAVKVISPLLEE